MYKIILNIVSIFLVIIDIIILVKAPKKYKYNQAFATIGNIIGIIFMYIPISFTKDINEIKESIPFIGFGALFYLITLIMILINIRNINLFKIKEEKRKRDENWK